jgi:hypothetical protein
MTAKVTRFAMAFVVFFAATFSVAPMAFCFAKAEQPVPACCPKPMHKPAHSESDRSNCPICKFNYCKLDPNPVLKTTTHSSPTVRTISTSLSAATPLQHSFTIRTANTFHYFDSSPPVYLSVCAFRI